MCELLRAMPDCEAIKMTRGHYRSCGKDPHACCVSDLLGEEPVIRSGRAETYQAGKDTGRYWDAGASNVHWVVATDRQVESGIRAALRRVSAPAVLIEGNSFLDFVAADFVIMVAPSGGSKIKPTARRALAKTSALYLFGDEELPEAARREAFFNLSREAGLGSLIDGIPLYTRESFDQLVSRIKAVEAREAVPLDGAVTAR